MRSFESFKASREKMDPSARKMTDYQWRQAYAAYRRVRGYAPAEEEGASGPHLKENRLTFSRLQSARKSGLIGAVRQATAYSRERILLDGISILSAVIFILLFLFEAGTGFSASLLVEDGSGNMQTIHSIRWGFVLASSLILLMQLGATLLLHSLIHLLIDIPDIMVFQSNQREKEKSENGSLS